MPRLQGLPLGWPALPAAWLAMPQLRAVGKRRCLGPPPSGAPSHHNVGTHLFVRCLVVSAPGRGGGLDLSTLSIVSGKTCWVVYVDLLLLNIGGNLHDAASVAAKVRRHRAAGLHRAPSLCRWQARAAAAWQRGQCVTALPMLLPPPPLLVNACRPARGSLAFEAPAARQPALCTAGGAGGCADTPGRGGGWGGPHRWVEGPRWASRAR